MLNAMQLEEIIKILNLPLGTSMKYIDLFTIEDTMAFKDDG